MITQIEKTYMKYKKIYNESSFIEDYETRRLLHNSLFLSIFTLFESFLKNIINNYVKNKIEEQYKVIDFSEYIVQSFLIDQKDVLESFIKTAKKGKCNASFKKIYKMLTKPIEKDDISNQICFKFLHKDVLESHYNNIFIELLGVEHFLKKFNVTISNEVGITHKNSTSAFDFINHYTNDIRNSIAHQNDSFTSTYSFEEATQAFLDIIKEINNKYMLHTNYKLTMTTDNLLDEFQ